MASKLKAELLELDGLGLAELRALWAERLGKPPIIASTEVTRRWLAWEFQAAGLGGFDAGTRRRLRQLARSVNVNPTSDTHNGLTLKPGTILTREWADTIHKVTVLEGGFGWNGRTWRSLSEIASTITGTRWSGPRFFGLRKRSSA
jgi:Protein of unknown function (DUF2924)